MELEVFAICDAATDSQGKLNILGAFDTLWAAAYPTVHAQCAVALRLRFRRIEQGKHQLVIHFVNEDGQLILPPLQGEINLRVPAEERSMVVNIVLNVQNIRLEAPGEYAVNLAVDGREEACLPLFARQVPPPAAGS